MPNPNPSKDTRFKPGESGNPSGRPKDTLKEYTRKKLAGMSEKEKDDFLKKIAPEMQWKMSEGNPHQSGDQQIVVTLPKPLLGGQSNDPDNNSNKETPKAEETQ